ncbi:Aste57867_20183 [Aphanomyces stellatus]|uniref:Aste57867_20183 protein n=1 Tax=Aphanomyces stellatus TaxID=120398 RepID=A0A485LFX1_9STRA|nr:hypothetical protein As57867_020117 [Aphanomyces stellatus]VFT96877.1 Aste57867_20183 [Aphanomyces stellatus]
MVRLLAVTAALATSLAASSSLIPPRLHRRFRIDEFLDQFEDKTESSGTDAVPDQWFESQLLDHNDPTNKATWKQRYFVSDKFYGGPGSPVLLYIDGEWTASNRTVVSTGLFLHELAKKHKAMVVSLEHRYYGESQPFPDFSSGNLKYLRAHQALADIVTFQDHFRATFNVTQASKWVAIGGSYPGMLAAWLKLKHPSRFAGIISSSGPIHTKADFFEYGDIVTHGLRYFGGDACVTTIQAAMTEAHRLLASDTPVDAEILKTLFNPCFDNTHDDNRSVFESQLFGAFQGIAQYNDFDADGSTGLTKVCAAFADSNLSPIEKLSRFVGNRGGDNCTYNSFQGYIDFYKNVTIDVDDPAARPWFYQTCSEFGFGQTTASGHGAFSPLKYATVDTVLYKLCAAVFDIHDVDARTTATLNTYGGLKIDVENVVSTYTIHFGCLCMEITS